MVVVVVALLLTAGVQGSVAKSVSNQGIHIKISNPIACYGITTTTTTTHDNARFGVIASPKRSSRVNCSWVIVNPQRLPLLISITEFDLSEGQCQGYQRCCSTWVSLYASAANHNPFYQPSLREIPLALPDDELLGGRYLCGSKPPRPVTTSSPRITVRYSQSGWYGHRSMQQGGFRMVVFAFTSNSSCRSDEFNCGESMCLPRIHLCDGKVDCPNHSDEMKCPPIMHRVQKGCGANEWYCGVGDECYTAAQRCDNTYHCSNAVDELSCRSTCQNEVACWGGGCYPLFQRCDGSPDCGDASDEAGCSALLCNGNNGTFLCNNQRCIRETWRCDQLDDCRDGSDEQDCLRNSVIGVAAMGGLMCSLLLVVAVGCTGRLYALRMGLTRLQGRNRGGVTGGQSGEGRGPPAPRSRLEEHLRQREMPPPYDVAINDASSSLFSTWGCHRQWRRPSVADREQTPPSPRVPLYAGTPPLESRCTHPPSQLGGEEVEKVEEGEDADFFSTQDDVPLLSNLVGGNYHGDEERSLEEEEEEGNDVPLLLDLISTSSTSSSSSTFELDSGDEETASRTQESAIPNTPSQTQQETQLREPNGPNGDVLSDTRAAVLALSAVQSHMDTFTQSDTELMSQ